ncbi:hypothetical protein [Micromonospora marina]|uniref:hypothetical protein n=1 Tax=Micromonospora marina TaxID=307120 RepID=UPI0034512803
MTRGGGKYCELTVDEAIKVAADLNEFVVVFDQIISRVAFGGADADLLVSYVTKRDVRRRLASARSAIFGALERVIGQEASDRIAEEGYRQGPGKVVR